MARRTPVGTREDAPAVQGLGKHKYTAQTRHELQEQALAGEAGSMQCKHPEQEIWWDSEGGRKKWNNGQGL